MRPGDFERERLGVWASEAVAEAALDVDCFSSSVVGTVGKPPPGRMVLAVDVHSRLRGVRESAIVAAWESGDVVDAVVVQHGPGVRWLPDRLLELCRKHQVFEVHMSVGSAKDVADDLQAAGVQLHPLPRDGFRSACMGLAQSLSDGLLRVQASPGLAAAVGQVPARVFPDGGWVFDGRRSDVSAAPLVAWAVAVQAVRAVEHADYDVLASVF